MDYQIYIFINAPKQGLYLIVNTKQGQSEDCQMLLKEIIYLQQKEGLIPAIPSAICFKIMNNNYEPRSEERRNKG